MHKQISKLHLVYCTILTINNKLRQPRREGPESLTERAEHCWGKPKHAIGSLGGVKEPLCYSQIPTATFKKKKETLLQLRLRIQPLRLSYPPCCSTTPTPVIIWGWVHFDHSLSNLSIVLYSRAEGLVWFRMIPWVRREARLTSPDGMSALRNC